MHFVLVHGGGFTSACWDRLVPLLDQESWCVDLPGRGERASTPVASVGIADCVQAIVHDITAHDLREVVLVAHSWTGTMVPGVVTAIPDRLAQLVFLASPVPPHGKALIDNIDPEVRENVMAGTAGGVFQVDRDSALQILCNDMDAEQTAFTLGQMVDDAAGILYEPVDLASLQAPVPRTYVRTLRDQTLPPEQQDRSRAALGDPPTIDLDAGHMAMISCPAELAAILNKLAASA